MGELNKQQLPNALMNVYESPESLMKAKLG